MLAVGLGREFQPIKSGQSLVREGTKLLTPSYYVDTAGTFNLYFLQAHTWSRFTKFYGLIHEGDQGRLIPRKPEGETDLYMFAELDRYGALPKHARFVLNAAVGSLGLSSQGESSVSDPKKVLFEYWNADNINGGEPMLVHTDKPYALTDLRLKVSLLPDIVPNR